MSIRILLAAGALILAPLDADAQSFRCVSKDGKRYYGSIVPEECYGQMVEELNHQGMVVRRIDPEATEKERLAKEADEAKKREQAAVAREASRRNRALLATYASEQDIENARARALTDNQKALREIEARIEQIRKRQSDYEKELEPYKGKNTPPATLLENIKGTQEELKAQQGLQETKKREVDSINAKYDEDKRRYAALTGRR